MPTALYLLKHDEKVGPGWLLDRCQGPGTTRKLVTVRSPEDLPMGIECQGVVLVGRHLDPLRLSARAPLLREQVVFVRTLVGLGVPFLGIDAGAQLLAAAMLGTLCEARDPAMGHAEIPLTEEGRADRLLGALGEGGLAALRWPTHRFTLPNRATLLAGTSAAPEAFRFGASAWGILAHPEVTPLALQDWLADPEGPGRALAPGARDALLTSAEAFSERQRAGAYALMDAFLECTRGFCHEPPPLAQLHPGPDHH